ncbi:MAG TPA: hypothetical protein VF469_39380, partial [Kofleriaceae bacterium]
MMKGTTEARTGTTSGGAGAADQGPTDTRVQGLRERAMDLIADASIHAERINAAAARLGLTPDLLNGMGDQLYEAAVAQLDVASKILERSQAIVDRLFELGARRRIALEHAERHQLPRGAQAGRQIGPDELGPDPPALLGGGERAA